MVRRTSMMEQFMRSLVIARKDVRIYYLKGSRAPL